MKWLGAIVAVFVALVGLWFILSPYSWHQKITVSVETPQGLKTGYSVSSAYGGDATFLNKSMGYPVESGASGEAVVVDLGGGRYLFALVSGGPFNAGINVIAHNVFNDQLPSETGERYKTLSNLRKTRPVSRDMYPLLVTFTDVNDSRTVKKVNPDDLAASFGPRYKLKGITLGITDEAVTRGVVEKVLGWLGSHPEPTLGRSPDIYNPIFAATVSHGDFIRR